MARNKFEHLENMRKVIKMALDEFLIEANKATCGNKSAGRRSRVKSSEIEKMFKEWRKETLRLGLK